MSPKVFGEKIQPLFRCCVEWIKDFHESASFSVFSDISAHNRRICIEMLTIGIAGCCRGIQNRGWLTFGGGHAISLASLKGEKVFSCEQQTQKRRLRQQISKHCLVPGTVRLSVSHTGTQISIDTTTQWKSVFLGCQLNWTPKKADSPRAVCNWSVTDARIAAHLPPHGHQHST